MMKKDDSLQDRRSYIRKPLEVEVNLTKKYTVKMDNISEGGLCLITEEGLTTGNIMKLLFFLPGNDELSIFGEVVWTEKLDDNLYQNGLEFWQIDEESRAKIKKYLES
jgi:hypothetical protein